LALPTKITTRQMVTVALKLQVTISAEANGKNEFLNLEEGAILEPNTTIGLIEHHPIVLE
jgi:hypothetical protein